MNIAQQQTDLVALIKQELLKEKPSSFFHSVWFRPLSSRFLFGDKYTRYEVIEPLIENKTLVFKAIESHQGEQMLRYVLA